MKSLAPPGLGQIIATGSLPEGGEQLGECKIPGGIDSQANFIRTARCQQLPAQITGELADICVQSVPAFLASLLDHP